MKYLNFLHVKHLTIDLQMPKQITFYLKMFTTMLMHKWKYM